MDASCHLPPLAPARRALVVRRVCAWCGAEQEPTRWLALAEKPGEITHTICKKCHDRLLAEMGHGEEREN